MNATKIGVIEPQVRDFERRYQVTIDINAVFAACEAANCLACDDAFLKTFTPPDSRDRSAELLAALESAYANFSKGGKLAFGAAYDLVMSHIGRGDIAVAKAVVEQIQIPAEVPGVPAEELATWTAKKTEILALFP